MEQSQQRFWLAVTVGILLLGSCWYTEASEQLADHLASQPVRVDGGLISGDTTDSNIRVFKGIPFAAPPVGKLRWQPPQPVLAWKGVRKANTFSASCMQVREKPTDFHFAVSRPLNEDCLYLNVWTPARSPKDKLPVLLWIHDSALVVGEGTRPAADGEALSSKGVVVITINYRLGVFGFFAHPQLSAESPEHVSGNYGLLDMVSAIKWARRNATAFGGDPDRITVFGESAGARAASALSTSPLVKDDIHAVIAADTIYTGGLTLAEAENHGVKIAKDLRINSIEELRNMPADKLQSQVGPRKYAYQFVVDGKLLTLATVFSAEKTGAEANIPILTGVTSGFATAIVSPISAEAFVEQSRSICGAHSTDLLDMYPATGDTQATASQMSLSVDSVAWTHDKWASLHARNGRRAYLYLFTRDVPAPPTAKYNIYGDPLPAHLGAYHTGEIAYMFNSLEKLKTYAWQPRDYELAKVVSSYIVNFVTKGDPNGPGLPPWPAYDDNSKPVMELGDEVKLIPSPLAGPKKALWDECLANLG